VTGLAADKLGRRRVMGSAIILMTICATGILGLAITDNFNPVLVLSLLALFGVARAFNTPASSSLVVNVVPKEDFPNAVGWITSSWQLATIAGPAAGGLLYGISGPFAYSVAAVIFAISAGLIFSLEKPRQEMETAPTNWNTIVGGFKFIWKEKIVFGAISLDLFAVLLGGAVALLPIYADEVLSVGPWGLGMLRAAPGIGAIIMIAIIIRFPVRDHAGAILLISLGVHPCPRTGWGL